MDNDFNDIIKILQSNPEKILQSNPEKKNEKSVLEQLQENLTAIQKQLDGLKAEENKPEPTAESVPPPQEKSRIDIALDNLTDAICGEVRESGKIFSISITSANDKTSGSTHTTTSTCIEDSINDLDEEVLAAKLEPFTNPKRIAILKALQNEDLTATDISMKTRCVGGQLYHHLNNLGNAGLISKEGDKFRSTGKTILVALNTVTCLISNSRNDAEVFVYEEKQPTKPQANNLNAGTISAKGIEVPSKPEKSTSGDTVPDMY